MHASTASTVGVQQILCKAADSTLLELVSNMDPHTGERDPIPYCNTQTATQWFMPASVCAAGMKDNAIISTQAAHLTLSVLPAAESKKHSCTVACCYAEQEPAASQQLVSAVVAVTVLACIIRYEAAPHLRCRTTCNPTGTADMAA